ncbi:MAG: hypothetical protein WC683_08050 [bacterium]
MADLTITAASVRPVGHCLIGRFTAGATLTPGQPVYLSGNDTVSLTDGSALTTAACIGLVVSNSNGAVSFSSGEEVDVVMFGLVTGFATNLAANTAVYVDDDAGVLADAVGTKVCRVGIGKNASTLLVNPMLLSSS